MNFREPLLFSDWLMLSGGDSPLGFLNCHMLTRSALLQNELAGDHINHLLIRLQHSPRLVAVGLLVG